MCIYNAIELYCRYKQNKFVRNRRENHNIKVKNYKIANPDLQVFVSNTFYDRLNSVNPNKADDYLLAQSCGTR